MGQVRSRGTWALDIAPIVPSMLQLSPYIRWVRSLKEKCQLQLHKCILFPNLLKKKKKKASISYSDFIGPNTAVDSFYRFFFFFLILASANKLLKQVLTRIPAVLYSVLVKSSTIKHHYIKNPGKEGTGAKIHVYTHIYIHVCTHTHVLTSQDVSKKKHTPTMQVTWSGPKV